LRIDTKDVIRGKKSFIFLDSGQLNLATVNYQIYFTAGSCEGPMQVNGAFHGIEKTCVKCIIEYLSKHEHISLVNINAINKPT
jgi:hypothetical protein